MLSARRVPLLPLLIFLHLSVALSLCNVGHAEPGEAAIGTPEANSLTLLGKVRDKLINYFANHLQNAMDLDGALARGVSFQNLEALPKLEVLACEYSDPETGRSRIYNRLTECLLRNLMEKIFRQSDSEQSDSEQSDSEQSDSELVKQLLLQLKATSQNGHREFLIARLKWSSPSCPLPFWAKCLQWTMDGFYRASIGLLNHFANIGDPSGLWLTPYRFAFFLRHLFENGFLVEFDRPLQKAIPGMDPVELTHFEVRLRQSPLNEQEVSQAFCGLHPGDLSLYGVEMKGYCTADSEKPFADLDLDIQSLTMSNFTKRVIKHFLFGKKDGDRLSANSWGLNLFQKRSSQSNETIPFELHLHGDIENPNSGPLDSATYPDVML